MRALIDALRILYSLGLMAAAPLSLLLLLFVLGDQLRWEKHLRRIDIEKDKSTDP